MDSYEESLLSTDDESQDSLVENSINGSSDYIDKSSFECSTEKRIASNLERSHNGSHNIEKGSRSLLGKSTVVESSDAQPNTSTDLNTIEIDKSGVQHSPDLSSEDDSVIVPKSRKKPIILSDSEDESDLSLHSANGNDSPKEDFKTIKDSATRPNHSMPSSFEVQKKINSRNESSNFIVHTICESNSSKQVSAVEAIATGETEITHSPKRETSENKSRVSSTNPGKTPVIETELEEEFSDLSLHSIQENNSPERDVLPTTPEPSRRFSYRISDNFNIRNAFSSTMMCDSPPSKEIRAFDDTLVKPEVMTPRHTATKMSKSPSLSVSDVVDLISDSDEEQVPTSQTTKRVTLKQPTLQQFINKQPSMVEIIEDPQTDKVVVTSKEYALQKEKVADLRKKLQTIKNTINTIRLEQLPDKGKRLNEEYTKLQQSVKQQEGILETMTVEDGDTKPASWDDLKVVSGGVQPRTFGKRALATHNQEKALTMDRLHHLHSSLKTCPGEDVEENDPSGLKVELMKHQRRALAWLMWREKQKPAGGILADDMGLGKTLTMIALMMKMNEFKEQENENSGDESDENDKTERRYKYYGGTLVVCPASLMNQWAGEIKSKVRKGLVAVELYHGPNRETKSKRLAKYTMVVTTYSIVMNEINKEASPLFKIKWGRIILDEAHQIRNYKSQTALAIYKLASFTRWVLTGTPVHNKEGDLYSLLKFLRCSPFDDLAVFKRWATEKNVGGSERLNTVMSSLMLRRTKAQLQEKGALQCLPSREWKIIEIHLDRKELDVYQKILIFSRTLFAQFLHQRAAKNQDFLNRGPEFDIQIDPNSEYYKMHQKLKKLNKVKEVKQHDILLLLLRLRQICCHPALIISMLEQGDLGADVSDEETEEMNLLDQLSKLNINDDEAFEAEGLATDEVGLAEAAKGIFSPSNPLFKAERESSKVKALIALLKERVISCEDKCIIVSQWTSFLRLISVHLVKEGIKFLELNGSIPVPNRQPIVDQFNDPNNRSKILLLSLTAGGVGLNLVGANHLILLDLHWNPQLEVQAQDRIYRVGQKKDVFIYKLMVVETIEERIMNLQERKKALAESLLTGARIKGNKLSLDDLKMLFNL